MNADSIQQACMADLGRQRQDELPLSNQERKGPSFAPSRRNGTGHIAPDLKKGLEAKWSVQIHDEESEQMLGLVVEDSRPWAKKIAQDFMNRNQVLTAPPTIRQESQGHKGTKGNNFQNVQPARLGSLIPPGGSVRHFGASKLTRTLPSKPKGRETSANDRDMTLITRNCDLQTLRRSQESTTASPTPSSAAPAGQSPDCRELVTMATPIRPPKPRDLENVVLRGICKLLHPKDQSVLLEISYVMKIRKDTDEGYLILSRAGKEDKIHNVLELLAPDLKENHCRVCSKVEKNGFDYNFQFPSVPSAHKFKIYLESLQQAAIREANSEQNKANTSATCVQATGKPQTSLDITCPVIESPSHLPTSETTDLERPAISTLPSTVPTPTKQANANGAAGGVNLVDLEPPSRSTQKARECIIEDAAEKLVELIEKILPEAAAAGLLLSDDAIADIEETAIEDWLARGFLQSETDDMKADLVELLRILVRLKRKAESRRRAQPVIKSLEGFDREPSSTRVTYHASELEKLNVSQHSAHSGGKRIKYTPSELEGIGGTRVTAPVNLGKSVMMPRRITETTRLPAPDLRSVSKYKNWLDEKPGEVATCRLEPTAAASPAQSPQMTNHNGIASNKDHSIPAGLATSRWARV
ncbi:uncharacterized protein MAM_05534 [Metarhizium album ARSEF 1941]|uniref:Uncharacterized protein n=1 Tax=Metarhizium album (strain ARSEF 1941) TaxID=1081103 RepID=A0A0B2WKK5_METAS|nr:uncharacterized protein MAM_05534 [Metarhizium album ARSEF 1941]KHN96591.1 hypothetical protein MAM_05534 [Metarhizium album ARSEF 1941]